MSKNIQVIDGANNTLYLTYRVDEKDFDLLFPNGQDIEFADDFIIRVGKKKAKSVLKRLWDNEISKKKVQGIHGTLFFDAEFDEKIRVKKQYFPTKKEEESIIPWLEERKKKSNLSDSQGKISGENIPC